MKYICIWLIRLYQIFLSPLKGGPTCRFTPTCSAYAIEAFSKRGFFVGMGLTVWRILRCNPYCAGGYDPVPERRPRRTKKKESEDKGNDSLSNKIGEGSEQSSEICSDEKRNV